MAHFAQVRADRNQEMTDWQNEHFKLMQECKKISEKLEAKRQQARKQHSGGGACSHGDSGQDQIIESRAKRDSKTPTKF